MCLNAGGLVDNEEISVFFDECDGEIGFREEGDVFSCELFGKNCEDVIWEEVCAGFRDGFLEDDSAFFDAERDV